MKLLGRQPGYLPLGVDPLGGHLPNCLIFVRRCANVVSKTVPFLLQFFWKKKHAVFLANFAEMYPFLNKIAKILRIVVA